MAFSTTRIKPTEAPLDPAAPPSAPVLWPELVTGKNDKSVNAVAMWIKRPGEDKISPTSTCGR